MQGHFYFIFLVIVKKDTLTLKAPVTLELTTT
jgi:hypothetical protein